MQPPRIVTARGAPSRDGQIQLYTAEEAADKPWFDSGRRVVFVNGMDNTGDDHMRSAQGLSLLQACPVIGIYNRTDGFWLDIGQCLTDKLNMTPQLTMGNLTTWAVMLEAGFRAARAFNPSLDKLDFVGSLIAENQATHSLYQYLVTLSQRQRARLKIFCHSQGNLITSNALTAVALARGEDSIEGIEVNSFGSPCRYWPPGIRRHNNAFTFDPVSWLDLRVDLESSKIGFVAAHSFITYMEHDAEFVVNRFRWGSFGMTANMDEDGLANFCVRLRTNAPRIKRIFRRLQSAHWTDSDDVAYLYVKKMRQHHDSVMRHNARTDRALIQLLIDLLDAGWTTGSEYDEMDYLRGLL